MNETTYDYNYDRDFDGSLPLDFMKGYVLDSWGLVKFCAIDDERSI